MPRPTLPEPYVAETDDETYVRRWIENFPLGKTSRAYGAIFEQDFRLQVLHQVNLVTFGTGYNKHTNGYADIGRMVKQAIVVPKDHPDPEKIPDVASLCDKRLWYTNQLDRIFYSRNHQGDRGRFITGQARFIKIYMKEMSPPKLYQIFRALLCRILDSIEDYSYLDLPFCHLLSCQHGHHRSQAVACLLQKLISYHWRHVDANVLHMDDDRDRETRALLRDLEFRSKFVSGLRNALSPPIYYVPLHRPAEPQDMGTF